MKINPQNNLCRAYIDINLKCTYDNEITLFGSGAFLKDMVLK